MVEQFTVSRHVYRSFDSTNTVNTKSRKSLRYSAKVRSSLETSDPVVVLGQVTEVDEDTFWPIINAAGDKTVVLKLDCNEDNKPLAKKLGIKVVPTFKILKHDKIMKEVTGAKLDKLVSAMEEVR